jgi:type IV secretion system protein VirB9
MKQPFAACTLRACVFVLGAVAAGAAPAFAVAQASVAPALLDHRVVSLLYLPTQVIRLHGWVGYHLHIVFEDGEQIKGLGGGDLPGLTYSYLENHLFLKPHAPILKTNITVLTNKRWYTLDYHVSPGQPDPMNDELVYSLQFNYPKDPAAAEPSQVTQDLEKSSAKRFQNMDYWYCGNPLLRPIGASDDGVHTRLRFAPAAELPAIFVKGDDGQESLLNFTVEGPDLVIQRLARHFILRRGKLVGCVTNKGFIGSGERLDTGTISPQVHRQTREIRP